MMPQSERSDLTGCPADASLYLFHEGDQEPYDKDAGNAEADGRRQTDPALDIERHAAVIPPYGMEELFQDPGGDEFQYGAPCGADQEDLPGRYESTRKVRQDPEYDHAEHSAAPVDRADGSEQESEVLPVMCPAGAVDAFIDPAHEAENDKVNKVFSDHGSSIHRARG